MRHGRAKAARKTLRYFERTVHLKSKPYYSVLLDATFLIAMIRITTVTANSSNDNNNENNNDQNNTKSDTIASRIERVLQVNGGGSSFSASRDDRLGHVDGGGSSYDDHGQHNSNHNHSHSNHFGVRFFIPQEAVEELEMIIQSFIDRAELTAKRKKKNEYKLRSKVFEDALEWIRSNSSKRHSHRGSGRCEVMPKFSAGETDHQQQQQQQEAEADPNENKNGEETITATDAVRRHIARDDGRQDEDPNNAAKNIQTTPIRRTYIVASQEEDLLDGLRMLGTVPILRCTNNASVLILEHPSKKGQRNDQGNEKQKWNCSLQNPAEKALVDAAWKAQRKSQKINITGGSGRSSGGGGGGSANNNNNHNNDKNKRSTSNKAKGPNPLSCKRKRSSSDGKKQGETTMSKSKKRRDRAQRKNETTDAVESSGSDKNNGDDKSSTTKN